MTRDREPQRDGEELSGGEFGEANVGGMFGGPEDVGGMMDDVGGVGGTTGAGTTEGTVAGGDLTDEHDEQERGRI